MKYWIHRDGENFGPYTIDELNQHLAAGQVVPSDLACAEGDDQNWVPVSQIVQPPSAPAPVAAPAPALNLSPGLATQSAATPPLALASASPQPSKFLGIMKSVGSFVVMIAVIVGIKTCSAGQDSDEAKAEAISALEETIPDWNEHRDYYLGLVDKFHPAAFDRAYTQKRRHSTFDEDQYARTLLTNMKLQVAKDGRKDLSISPESLE